MKSQQPQVLRKMLDDLIKAQVAEERVRKTSKRQRKEHQYDTVCPKDLHVAGYDPYWDLRGMPFEPLDDFQEVWAKSGDSAAAYDTEAEEEIIDQVFESDDSGSTETTEVRRGAKTLPRQTQMTLRSGYTSKPPLFFLGRVPIIYREGRVRYNRNSSS